MFADAVDIIAIPNNNKRLTGGTNNGGETERTERRKDLQ